MYLNPILYFLVAIYKTIYDLTSFTVQTVIELGSNMSTNVYNRMVELDINFIDIYERPF